MSDVTTGSMPWQQTNPPPGKRCAVWTPTRLSDLPRVRRECRSQVLALTPQVTAAEQRDAADRLADAVAALDELMSNALRHGRAPVQVEVCLAADGLLLLVGDHAGEDPPQPTAERDPRHGGMGLGIVARSAVAHGWTIQGGTKTVWALMPL